MNSEAESSLLLLGFSSVSKDGVFQGQPIVECLSDIRGLPSAF